MSAFPQISITFAMPAWLYIVGCVAAILFSFWGYRRTVPPVDFPLRVLLSILRSAALIGGLTILAQPSLHLMRNFMNRAGLIILADRSASMGLNVADNDRSEMVSALMTGEGYNSLSERYDLYLYDFADSLGVSWESANDLLSHDPQGVGTNLSRSWVEVIDESWTESTAGIIIISDGSNNHGPDPSRIARNSKVPIWTIGVGSVETIPDLMIKSINTSPVVYKDSEVPVEVHFSAVEAAGEQVRLILRNASGTIVGRRNILIDGELQEWTSEFNLVVGETGHQRYSVEIQPLDNENTIENNKRNFYLNVLDNRMRIMILAGPPDNNLGDLIRRLSTDEHISLLVYTQSGKGFYEGGWPTDSLFKQLDAIILHHFPERGMSSERLRKLDKLISENNIPICFFDGGEVVLSKLRILESNLPVTVNERIKRYRTGKLTPLRPHSIISDPSNTDFRAGWADLPPVNFAPGRFKSKRNSKILVEFATTNRPAQTPAIIVMETPFSKSAVILTDDIWRLGLSNSYGSEFLNGFYGRLIRWLAVRKTNKNIEIHLDKELYSNQEPLKFSVTVLNESMQPHDDAQVDAALISESDTITSSMLEGIGQGKYIGSFQTWKDGEYSLVVKGSVEGQSLGTDQRKIAVEPFSIEFLDTRLNEELLKDIAEFSGGSYAHIKRADSLFNSLEIESVMLNDEKRIDLWGRGWLLWVVIGLLTVEWFIRMRTGML